MNVTTDNKIKLVRKSEKGWDIPDDLYDRIQREHVYLAPNKYRPTCTGLYAVDDDPTRVSGTHKFFGVRRVPNLVLPTIEQVIEYLKFCDITQFMLNIRFIIYNYVIIDCGELLHIGIIDGKNVICTVYIGYSKLDNTMYTITDHDFYKYHYHPGAIIKNTKKDDGTPITFDERELTKEQKVQYLQSFIQMDSEQNDIESGVVDMNEFMCKYYKDVMRLCSRCSSYDEYDGNVFIGKNWVNIDSSVYKTIDDRNFAYVDDSLLSSGPKLKNDESVIKIHYKTLLDYFTMHYIGIEGKTIDAYTCTARNMDLYECYTVNGDVYVWRPDAFFGYMKEGYYETIGSTYEYIKKSFDDFDQYTKAIGKLPLSLDERLKRIKEVDIRSKIWPWLKK